MKPLFDSQATDDSKNTVLYALHFLLFASVSFLVTISVSFLVLVILTNL